MGKFGHITIIGSMTTSALSSAPPNESSQEPVPFGSWPEDGSFPIGYFSAPVESSASDFYRKNGYLVVPDVFSKADIENFRRETAGLCRNDDNGINGIAPAGPGMSDEKAMRRVLCIHFPHKLSDYFRGIIGHEKLVQILTHLIGPNVKCMQSMLFVKAYGKPGQAWHQDEDFIPTRDRSLAGAWIAIDDATVENGCLWVLPGSHQRGVLWPQKFHFDDRFDCTHESFDFPWEDSSAVPVEVKAGSIVFFNGYLLHRSLSNRATSGFRRSLVSHYMSAESLLPWKKPDEKTSMALADYRDIVMVAGKDPFAYKGVEEIAKAFVRSDGQGGCADWNDEEQKRKAAEHARLMAEKTSAR
jgi:phytanoyl-CoA hydroxylase